MIWIGRRRRQIQEMIDRIDAIFLPGGLGGDHAVPEGALRMRM